MEWSLPFNDEEKSKTATLQSNVAARDPFCFRLPEAELPSAISSVLPPVDTPSVR